MTINLKDASMVYITNYQDHKTLYFAGIGVQITIQQGVKLTISTLQALYAALQC